MSIVLPSGLTPTFAWLAMKPTNDIDHLLGYIDDVVTEEDKKLLMSFLKPYVFSERRNSAALSRCVVALKKLRNMQTIEVENDGL